MNFQEDKLTVARARKIQKFLSQPFFVAEVFTGSPGKLVDLNPLSKASMRFVRVNMIIYLKQLFIWLEE